MYGSIKGIAGNSLGTIKTLELPTPEESESEIEEMEEENGKLF